jgi:hypothetical protein
MKLKKDYVLLNILGGTRLDIKGEEDIKKTCGYIIKLMFDLNKEWNVEKTDRYSENDALLLNGYSNEDGNWQLMLLIKKEKFNPDAYFYKDWEKVN